MSRVYLHPVPAEVLRGGLNLRAEVGRKFSEDDAAADVMLDLDLVAMGHARPGPTGLPNAVRYYAVRWGWSKTEVARGLSGDPSRGVEPDLIARAAAWRARFGGHHAPAESGDTWGQDGDTGGQNTAETPPKTAIRGQSGDSWGQSGDKVEQSSILQSSTLPTGEKDAREEPAPGGGAKPRKPKPRTKAPPSPPPELPACIDPDAWAEWTAHRSEIKHPLTPTQTATQLRQLTTWNDAGHDPNAILRQSIANGWRGLFEPKPSGTGGARPARGPSPENYPGVRRSVRAALGL